MGRVESHCDVHCELLTCGLVRRIVGNVHLSEIPDLHTLAGSRGKAATQVGQVRPGPSMFPRILGQISFLQT